jgi:hypothetical protein
MIRGPPGNRDVLFCRDPRFRLSQITWRMGVAHHPTEDIWGRFDGVLSGGLSADACGTTLPDLLNESDKDPKSW